MYSFIEHKYVNENYNLHMRALSCGVI